MNADATSSARVIELDYETNRAVVRFEGEPPEITNSVLFAPVQCGWIDEFGNVFPIGAWKPANPTYHDSHKTSWTPIYKASI